VNPADLHALFASVAGRAPETLAVAADGSTHGYADVLADAAALARSWSTPRGGDPLVVEVDAALSPYEAVCHLLGGWALDATVAFLPAGEGGRPVAAPADVRPIAEVWPDDADWLARRRCCLVVPTSGTAGEPKLIAHNAEGLLRGLLGTVALQAEVLGQPSPTTRGSIDTILAEVGELQQHPLGLAFFSAMPPSTIAGITLLMRALLTGERLVVRSSFAADLVLGDWRDFGVTSASLAPFMAQQVVRHLRGRPADLPSLSMVGVGGGPASATLLRELEAATGAVTASGYGSTELGGAAIVGRFTDPPEVRWGTVGRPVPGVIATLRSDTDTDTETETDAAAGEDNPAGELVIESPAQLLGVIGVGPQTAPALATGDLATIDADGNVRLAGRTSAFILRGGRRIDPVAIEDAIRSVPGAVDASVLGVPSRIPGEEDVLAVVEADPDPELTSRIRRTCLDRLPPWSQPRRVAYVDRLPRTADGFVQRHRLRDLAERGRL
jgi:acyl-CoA synthetase (AMP-forming)/AMP-acid ligase II